MAARATNTSFNIDANRSSYTATVRVVPSSKPDTTASAGYDTIIADAVATGDIKYPGVLLETFSRTSYLGPLRSRRITVVPVNPTNGATVFDVTMHADTDYFYAGNAGTRQWILPVSTEFEVSDREIELWRTSYTTNPSANINSTTDIGGTSTTTGGKPITFKAQQIDVKVSIVVDTENGPSNLISLYDRINTVKDKWNSASFLHWQSPNLVFCTGANITQVRDEFYRVTYHYRWDQLFDAVQEPERDRQGQIYFTAGTDDPRAVYWVSPYRATTDHNNIFNDAFDSTIAKKMAKEGWYI